MNKKVRLVKIGEVGGRKMRLGYVQVRQKKKSSSAEIRALENIQCDFIYIDGYQASKKELKNRTELKKLLRESKAGDTVVLSDFLSLGTNYHECLVLIKMLENYDLELEIATVPEIRLVDWAHIIHGLKNQMEPKETTIRVKKFSKKGESEKSQYRFFAKDPYYRRMYREIIQLIMEKRSLREIAKERDVPLGTIIRIRKDYEKLKQTMLLISIFFLTIICLKMAQSYSTNPILQLVICAVMTGFIFYFSYSDSQSE